MDAKRISSGVYNSWLETVSYWSNEFISALRAFDLIMGIL